MKTILTLAAFCLITVATMAADKNPSVIIRSTNNYVVTVDGKRFRNDNLIRLDRIHRGTHTIRVYERRRGFFGSRLRLVSTKRFQVRNQDLRITIGRFGFVQISEMHDRGRDRFDQKRRRGPSQKGNTGKGWKGKKRS